jgi:hypothetical protein
VPNPASPPIAPLTPAICGLHRACLQAVLGYRMIITLPKKMSNEKVFTLKALGAVVKRTPTDARCTPGQRSAQAAHNRKRRPTRTNESTHAQTYAHVHTTVTATTTTTCVPRPRLPAVAHRQGHRYPRRPQPQQPAQGQAGGWMGGRLAPRVSPLIHPNPARWCCVVGSRALGPTRHFQRHRQVFRLCRRYAAAYSTVSKSTHGHRHTHTRAHTHTHICTHTHTHGHKHTHTNLHTHTHIHTHCLLPSGTHLGPIQQPV